MWKYPKYRHLLTPCYLCATATAHRAWLIGGGSSGGGCRAIRVVHCGAVGSVECGTFSDNICLNCSTADDSKPTWQTYDICTPSSVSPSIGVVFPQMRHFIRAIMVVTGVDFATAISPEIVQVLYDE